MTITTQFGTIAENIPSGLTGAVNWTNLSSVLLDDGFRASANLSPGHTGSNFLYLHGFDMQIPAGSVIEGIEVFVKRYAVGTLQDYAVFIAYLNNGQVVLSPINKALPGNWLGVTQILTYGGPNDLWGIPWVYYALNDNVVGAVIAVTGDGSVNNAANIDTILLSVHYRQNIFEFPTGGVYASGRVSGPVLETTTGRGLGANGRASFTYNYTKNFDIFGSQPWTIVNAGGTAFYEAGFPIEGGGAKLGGSAKVNSTFSVDLRIYNYDFYCTGEKGVPPTFGTQNLAYAHVEIDPILNKLSWNIRHDLTPADTVRFKGPATRTGTAPVRLSLDALGPTTSPLIGSATITNPETIDLINGLWYLALTDDTDNITIRGQVVNEPLGMGGTAALGQQYPELLGQGAMLKGSATVQWILHPTPSGGVKISGIQQIWVEEFIDAVGVRANGSADVLQVKTLPVSGGARLGASAAIQVKYNVVATSGLLATGNAPRSLTIPIVANGLVAAGNGIRLLAVSPPISGGVKISGGITLQQSYAAQPLVGGLRIYGSWAPEKLKFFQKSVHSGYGRALSGENILKVEPSKEEIIQRTGKVVAPALKTNRYVLRPQAGWCEFADGVCGTAYLPAIIKNRQRGMVPPKEAATAEDYSQIATATLNDS